MLHVAAPDQLVGDRLDRVRRDREPDARVVARVALDLRVDADDLAAQVQQRAAGVAVVDRGVGLDRVVDREVVRRLHAAVQRADDAERHGVLEPERAADRDDRVTDRERRRVAEREGMQHVGRSIDLDHGEVGRRIGADHGRGVAGAVRELHAYRRGAVHDVVVRDDVAGGVVDEAGALRLALLAELRRVDVDLDHRVLRALVDAAHARHARRRRRRRARDRHLARDRVPAVVHQRRGQDGRAAGAQDGRGEERRDRRPMTRLPGALRGGLRGSLWSGRGKRRRLRGEGGRSLRWGRRAGGRRRRVLGWRERRVLRRGKLGRGLVGHLSSLDRLIVSSAVGRKSSLKPAICRASRVFRNIHRAIRCLSCLHRRLFPLYIG